MLTKELCLVAETVDEKSEEFSIPLCLDDLLSICQEYNKLGMNIQQQIETLIEMGVEESIKCGYVKQQSLPHIKNFLNNIYNNPYFGDASSQSIDLITEISKYIKNIKPILIMIN